MLLAGLTVAGGVLATAVILYAIKRAYGQTPKDLSATTSALQAKSITPLTKQTVLADAVKPLPANQMQLMTQPHWRPHPSGVHEIGTSVVPGIYPETNYFHTNVKEVWNHQLVLENGIVLDMYASPVGTYQVGQPVSLQPTPWRGYNGAEHLVLPRDGSVPPYPPVGKVNYVQPRPENTIAKVRVDRMGALIRLEDDSIWRVTTADNPLAELGVYPGQRLVISGRPGLRSMFHNFDSGMQPIGGRLVRAERASQVWDRAVSQWEFRERWMDPWFDGINFTD